MDITIVLPVSRENYLREIFTNLEFLECDRERTNLLVYVDGNESLYEKARNYTVMSKFAKKLCLYRSRGLAETGVIHRRHRIAAIHNELKGVILPCDYIFLLEDDTLYPNNTIQKLAKWYSIYPYAGFISAEELGRWGLAYIGGWKVNDPYNITEIQSIDEASEFREIDAAGFYCMFTTHKLYTSHDFKAYENILGPDFDFGVTMRRAGYKNYMDQSIKCRHLTQKGAVEFGRESLVGIKYTKDEGKWHQTIQTSITIKQ